jgi:uncharacterized protein (TIGR03086 family)
VDSIKIFKTAVDQTGGIVSGVKPDQLGDATPCADWDVNALLNHTISVVMMFDKAARGAEFDGSHFANDNVGRDAGASYAAAAAKLHEAVGAPGVIDATWNMPFGAVPGSAALGFATAEVAQHGWDVAKATGQKPDFDPEVSEVAWAAIQAAPAELVRNPGVFGPESDCPESAPLHDRLAAFVGRKV